MAVDVNEVGKVCLTDALLRLILHIGLMHGRNNAFCHLTDRPVLVYLGPVRTVQPEYD